MSTDLNSMTKAQLIEIINELNEKLSHKRARSESNRKNEMLLLLAEAPATIFDLAEKLNISTKNVSSLFCYLKKDGFGFIVNENSQRVLTKYKDEPIDAEFVREYVKK